MFSKLSYWWDPKNSLWTGKRGLFSALRCYTTIKKVFYSSPLSGLTLYKWEFSESGTLIGIPLIRRHVLLLKWPPLKASFNLGGQLNRKGFSQLMMLISFSEKGSKKKLLIDFDWRLVCTFAVYLQLQVFIREEHFQSFNICQMLLSLIVQLHWKRTLHLDVFILYSLGVLLSLWVLFYMCKKCS